MGEISLTDESFTTGGRGGARVTAVRFKTISKLQLALVRHKLSEESSLGMRL